MTTLERPGKPSATDRKPPQHPISQLLVAWLPLGLLLAGYGAAQLINRGLSEHVRQGARNALGFPLHISEPGTVDSWIFGQLPTKWLQNHLHTAAGPAWYDAVGALVYVSHFVVIPVLAAVLWFRNRDRFRDWIGCVLLLTSIGILTYVVYPMAPPWLADQLGVLDGAQRISGIGWEYLHLDPIGSLLSGSQAAANPVAAMPSLHAASAALLALFCWSRAAWWTRCLLALYTGSMAVTLVYTGEHYVIDVLAGWLAAALAVGGWQLTRRANRSAPVAVVGR